MNANLNRRALFLGLFSTAAAIALYSATSRAQTKKRKRTTTQRRRRCCGVDVANQTDYTR